MTGSDPTPKQTEEWYILRNESTDQVLGFINESGETRGADPETIERVDRAFDTHLLVQDDNVVHELGMCFDGVCSIGPEDPAHDQMVLRNLGSLTGLRPEAQDDRQEHGSDTE